MNTNRILKLDFNQRERERFAEDFKLIAKTAEEFADPIQNKSDEEIIQSFFLFHITLLGIRDLSKIIVNAVEESSGDLNFPEFIES